MAYNYEYPYVDPNRHNSDWLLNYVKEVKAFLDKCKDELDKLAKKDLELQAQIDKLQYWIDNFDSELIAEAVKKWIGTMILVSISDAGYIVYTIPESWEDITFNTTGLDINLPLQTNYGYLVLSY